MALLKTINAMVPKVKKRRQQQIETPKLFESYGFIYSYPTNKGEITTEDPVVISYFKGYPMEYLKGRKD